MKIKGVIFDLDGVIVTTDQMHYAAWKKVADEEGIYFDEEINKKLRGVSRLESLEIILQNTKTVYDDSQKEMIAGRKNEYYKYMLGSLSQDHILPGVLKLLNGLKVENIKIAVGSSSKNARTILNKIGMGQYFDAVADGNEIKRSKPDPEVFLLAAMKLGLDPEDCLVVEDAEAGIDAAFSCGMKTLGIGAASTYLKADYRAKNLENMHPEDIHRII